MMKILYRISIATKVIIISTILAAVFLGSSFGYLALKARKNLVAATEQTLMVRVQNSKEKIEVFGRTLHGTTLALSETPPFQGIIRARDAGGFDEQDNSSYQQWRTRLAQIFVAQMKASGVYNQIRYIDETGHEIVRTDFKEGTPIITPEAKLQNKAHADYFQAGRTLEEGDVYVSHTSLNKEGSPPTFSLPFTGVIRLVTPIYNEVGGEFRGVFVINVFADEFLSLTSLTTTEYVEENYVIGNSGFFIEHPDESKRWGGQQDFDTGYSFIDEFGKETEFSEEMGSLRTADSLIVYAKARPDPENLEREWTIVREVPLLSLFAATNDLIRNSLFTGLITFFILFAIFLTVVRRLLAPLEELVVAVGHIGAGDFETRVKVRSGDEIGKVAEAFNSMTEQLQESYASLENKIREKTKELSGQVSELEKARTAMINVLEDVEEEKKKSQALAQDLDKFRQAVEGTSDMIIITDPKGVVIYGNEAVERITGYKVSEAVGYKAAALWKIPMPQEFYKELWQTIKIDKKPFHAQLKNKRKNGSIYDADVSIAPVLDENENITFFVGIERDITKEKQVDRAKTEFVSLASHQLRTPLSTVNWYAEMLIAGDVGELNDDQKKYLEEIYTGNQRMVDLVNSLLNVSRLELGTFMVEPEKADLRELSSAAIHDMQALVEKRNITIKENYEDIGDIEVDKKLMNMIFQNLISNAVKYSNEGSEVNVSIAKVGEMARIQVTDSGVGIPAHQQERIFQKLFRADNVRETDTNGTGLGLYIVKSVVENAGGTISFTSKENEGTTFEVNLPLSGMKKKGGDRSLD